MNLLYLVNPYNAHRVSPGGPRTNSIISNVPPEVHWPLQGNRSSRYITNITYANNPLFLRQNEELFQCPDGEYNNMLDY